jgi:hypothetical protein
MGRGRPAWVPTPEAIEKVEELGALGMNHEQICDCLGIHVDTYIEKRKDYPEFGEAVKRGQAKGIAMVTAALQQNMFKGNVTAQIFYLKCKAKWREEDAKNYDDSLDKAKELIRSLKDASDGRSSTTES